MELVLTLEQIDSDNRESVGGKSFALAAMVKNGMQVPVIIYADQNIIRQIKEAQGTPKALFQQSEFGSNLASVAEKDILRAENAMNYDNKQCGVQNRGVLDASGF